VGPRLEIVGLLRLVRGFQGVLISSGAFFLLLKHSFWLSGVPGDEADGARADSWRDCFVVSLLGD
jgi:hypothetical protein